MRPRIVAVKPVLIGLKAPKTFARTARSVRLRVTVNVATTLRAGIKRFAVGPKARTITVALPRKGTLVTLRLTLGRGRLASTSLVRLRRR